jgi:group II intron reverse transcriptase/maturase
MTGGRQPREGNKPQSAVRNNPRAYEKSDAFIVAEKSAKAVVTPVESTEQRSAAKGKALDRNTFPTQDGKDVHTHIEWLGQRAVKNKEERFVNLLSHIKVPLLKEAYMRLKKKAAAGVDGETWSSYGQDLDAKLLDLQDRVHRGSYHPRPVRRAHIPKPDGRMRPLGIPALEDKIVQQAVKMLLQPIYEAKFLGFSYGFRPGRSQHDALDALFVALHRKTDWVLDADVHEFFDTVDHGWMQRFIEHRIGDKRLVRLLMKWLHAGVMEEGKVYDTEQGTPQGGIISPLLANVYLHYVVDLWAQAWRKRHARGEVYVVRYADDLVVGFQYETDARAMKKALAERLAKFKLQLHPDKTRVLRFGRFAQRDCTRDGRKRPETFDFLGFTHICGQGPDGRFRLIRRTSRKKRRAKLAALRGEMRKRTHDPPAEQYRWLSSVLRGHYNYYGVPGNFLAMASFRYQVRSAWHRRLQRRSQRAKWTAVQRETFDGKYLLPFPRIKHPHSFDRFGAKHAAP